MRDSGGVGRAGVTTKPLVFAVLVAAAIIGACSTDTEQEVAGPPAETAAPTAAVTPIATTEAIPIPSAVAAPTAVPIEPTAAPPAALEVWFPRAPESFEDFSRAFPVERVAAGEGEGDPTPEDYLYALLELWVAGPTATEIADGYLPALPAFEREPGCVEDLSVELRDDLVVVTLCGTSPSAGVGDDARTLGSFERTVLESGVAGAAALLYEGGERCYGNLGDEPLSCLETGFGCPDGEATSEATVVGVNEWVRMRGGPSIDAPEIGRLDAGTVVTVFPETLESDGQAFWWVTVVQPQADRCASVAATFLGYAGATSERPLAGVGFELPSSGDWTHRPRLSPTQSIQWTLDDAAGTSISLQIFYGAVIDTEVAERRSMMASFDIMEDPGWFNEVEVEGADRAVLLVTTIGPGADAYGESLLLEIGELTLEARSTHHEFDIGTIPLEEIRGFIDSIAVDPAVFLAGAVPDG